jgi:hypothetical protein
VVEMADSNLHKKDPETLWDFLKQKQDQLRKAEDKFVSSDNGSDEETEALELMDTLNEEIINLKEKINSGAFDQFGNLVGF